MKTSVLQTIQPESGFRIAPNWQKIGKMTMTSEFADMTPSWYFWRCFVFLFILVTGPSFKWTTSLFLELLQFAFIRDWPEIWKSEILPSSFSPSSRDWGKLRLPILTRLSLMKCYWMQQNSRVFDLIS